MRLTLSRVEDLRLGSRAPSAPVPETTKPEDWEEEVRVSQEESERMVGYHRGVRERQRLLPSPEELPEPPPPPGA